MKKETAVNQPAEIDNVKLDLLTGFRRFFGEITIEPPQPPPAPLGRKRSKIETTSESDTPSIGSGQAETAEPDIPSESSQLNLEI